MKVQITTTQTQEKEIELPYFSKSESGLFYKKIISDNKTLVLKDTSIEYYNFPSIEPVEITEEEFNMVFARRLNDITGIKI